MGLVDIHSHILPGVDDGAQDVEMSLKLLDMMKAQGITDVVATPHFYASDYSMGEYIEQISEARAQLNNAIAGLDVPNIYMGSEVHYFKGIGSAGSIGKLCYENTNYILLELSYSDITKYTLRDINNMRYDFGIIPILAHLERYSKLHGFKEILKLIEQGVCLAQLNATSLFASMHKRVAHKLIKGGYVSFLGTDSHSPEYRPPMMDVALKQIEKDFGSEYVNRILKNHQNFLGKLSAK